MISRLNFNSRPTAPETYPLGEKSRSLVGAFALVAVSHTSVEQRIYAVMLSAFDTPESLRFTARSLGLLSGIRSLTTIRRGLDGLVMKRNRADSEVSSSTRLHKS